MLIYVYSELYISGGVHIMCRSSEVVKPRLLVGKPAQLEMV